MMPRLPVHRFPARTMPGLLVHTARRVPNKVFLRFIPAGHSGPPREVTFEAFASGVGQACAYLRECGVGPDSRVLLLAENSPEWQMFSLGAQLLRAEPAALFSSLGAPQVQDIARRVRPRVLVVSTQKQWEKLRPVAQELMSAGLAAVVSAEALEAPEGIGRKLFTDVVSDRAPRLSPQELEQLAGAVDEEDPYLLLFTSGTTGRAKGVRLPQRSIVHAIEGGAIATATSEAEEGLHLLPFGHVAGHDQFALALAQGHGLVMIAGRNELDQALALSPTYLFSVPLIYERIREAVEQKLASLPGPLSALARQSVEAGGRVRVEGSRRPIDLLLTRLADLLVGRSVRKRLGGRVRGVFAGGAPTPPGLFRFFEGLGIPYVELYGMSETAGLISSNLFSGPRRPGAVGLVSADHEVRIAEDGELQLQGPLLLSGFLEPADGADVFTEDGYFRTGDLARLSDDGMLTVEGRKKSILVLSTGKKLSPEPIELAMASAPPIEAAVLLGDGRPFVTAAMFVEKEALTRFERDHVAAEAVLLEIAHARLAAFSEYERPKRIVIIPGSPMDYPDLVTPTLKVKRDALVGYLGDKISELYRQRKGH